MESERELEEVSGWLRLIPVPARAAPFLYRRGGRLFRYDVKAPSEPWLDIPDQICQLKLIRRSVFFLDVRELLLEPDSALRLARRAFSCAAKEDGTTRQCDSSNIRARVLARDGCRRA